MTSMTFHLHLANHANKKGLFPVMLRMTQNRKSKRLRTLVEVRTAEWNKNKECEGEQSEQRMDERDAGKRAENG